MLPRNLKLWYNGEVLDDLERIGLVAVQRELAPLLDMFRHGARDRQGDALLHVAQVGDRRLILAEVLPGPVSAALGAQALIARHGARCLIGFGSAGALDPCLLPGDLVVVQRAFAHDAGSFLGKRFEPVGVMGRDEAGRVGYRRSFEADPGLVALAANTARSLERKAYMGAVVTGNQVVFSSARRRWLRHTFGALAVEMETAAVAQVAVAHRLPWVAVRAISDGAGDELILDYSRLRRYLDEDLSEWRHRLRSWWYLFAHPHALRRLRRLHKGLALASDQAACLVQAMLQV
jgi:5'-methylthioadenosine/S-adenosylhomocysteine nucleosidase